MYMDVFMFECIGVPVCVHAYGEQKSLSCVILSCILPYLCPEASPLLELELTDTAKADYSASKALTPVSTSLALRLQAHLALKIKSNKT